MHMAPYDNPRDFADMMEAFADDAEMMGNNVQNMNDRHPIATFNLGVAFGLRYAAYEARAIDDDRL